MSTEEIRVECLVPINNDIIREHFWVPGKRRKSLKRLQEYCDNLLDSLKTAGKLTTFGTHVEIREEESYFCVELCGGMKENKELFSRCLMEFLTPATGCKWVLELVGQNLQLKRSTYLGVPEIFSESKEAAECFRNFMGSICKQYRVRAGSCISPMTGRSSQSCLQNRVEVRKRESE